MKKLTPDGSFVGDRRIVRRKSESVGMNRWGIVVAIVIFISVTAVFTVIMGSGTTSHSAAPYFRSVSNDLGMGNNTPAITVDTRHGVFAIAWYGYDSHKHTWYLNITLIGSNDGSILGRETITSDINIYYGKPFKYGPQIAYDPDDNGYLLIWYSANKSLDGALLTDHAQLVYGPFVINRTATHVSPNAFGLSYAGNHQFNVVWSSTTYKSYFRSVKVDTSSNPPVTLGTEVQISDDPIRSHVNHEVATDIGEGTTMVVWRNSTGDNTKYNITGKIFDAEITTVYKEDFTVADGFKDGKKYDYPNVAGGTGLFFVVYANSNSPYDVHGKIYASDGTLAKEIDIIDSSYVLKYYGIGVAYNGSGGFVVVCPDSSKNIVALLYDTDGNLVWHKTIVEDGDSNEGARVAVDPSGNGNPTYQFVWYSYTDKVVRTSFWAESELVPEFSAAIPMLAVLLVFVAIWRRK